MDEWEQTHLSFLLRVQRLDHEPIWRFQLIDVRNGERHGFTELAALAAFIADQIVRLEQPDVPAIRPDASP